MPFPGGGERFRPRMQQFEPSGAGGSGNRNIDGKRQGSSRESAPGKSAQPVQGSMERFEAHKSEAEALGFPSHVAESLAALRMTPTREDRQIEAQNRRVRFGRWLAENNVVNEGTPETVHTRITGTTAGEVLESAFSLFSDSVRQAEEEKARADATRAAEVIARRQAVREQRRRRAENVAGYQAHLRSQGLPEDPNVRG